MNILITGAKGFIGKNLVAELKNRKYTNIYEFDIDTEPILLDNFTEDCDFVFHLAGVNRPKDPDEFMQGNFVFTTTLLESLKKHNNKAPILVSSSIQANLDNPYGRSKKASEDLLFSYSLETGAKVYIYSLPNVFGKWCRPNYNSAIATFCNNIARDLPIQINDPDIVMNLVYIDDIVTEFIEKLECKGNLKSNELCYIETTCSIKLGEIVDLIRSFKTSRVDLRIPDMSNSFIKKLYNTYLSYLANDDFRYPLKMNFDNKCGSFTEFIKTPDRGQISINIIKPGITKGNHWHQTKNEKFLVVSGKGVIHLRNINEDNIIDYYVSGDKLEVVDIPVGYTHNIENLGEMDMVTVMWVNECFNPNKLDTYFEEV